jgi:hypothetical protein
MHFDDWSCLVLRSLGFLFRVSADRWEFKIGYNVTRLDHAVCLNPVRTRLCFLDIHLCIENNTSHSIS